MIQVLLWRDRAAILSFMAKVKELPTSSQHLLLIASQLERVIENLSRMTSRGEQMVKRLDVSRAESSSPVARSLLISLVQKGYEDLADGSPPHDHCDPYLDQDRLAAAKDAVMSARQHLEEIRENQLLDDEGRQLGLDAVEELDAAFDMMADCYRELQTRVVEQLGRGPSQTTKQTGKQLRNQLIKDIAKKMRPSDRTPAKVLKRAEKDTEMERLLKQFKDQEVRLSYDIVKKQIRPH